ncbi:MAG: hypothetical protein Q9222_003028 [Ikaeria aurantiellina]
MGQDADFSLAEGHGYMLDRSYLAACRLNVQHYLWKDALGYDIHPSITLPQAPIIADVAAGTAMWVMDVARTYPLAQVEGFDNDLSQAPSSRWLPSNAHLRHWDLFTDVPDDMVGKYDLVHVRLLVLVLQREDAPAFLQKVMQMLKPGGYLQWDELDCAGMSVKHAHPSSSTRTPALEQLREMCWAGGRHDWTIDLGAFAVEISFEKVSLERRGDPDRLVRAFNEQHLFTMEEFAVRLLRVGKKEEADVFFKVIAEAYRESLGGAALCIPRVISIVRKVL